MANENYAYEGLSVAIRERGDAGLVEFGVVVEGTFVPFAAHKLEGFREDVKEGREQQQAEQAQAEQPQPDTQPPPPSQ